MQKALSILLIGAATIQSVASYSAMGTNFDGIEGYPYGGCGVPGANVGYDYVALNVQNTPQDYKTWLSRPITDAAKIGTFNNGKNCGRYVNITLGKYCTGTNSGETGKAWCYNGAWVDDSFTGASALAIVADSCQDGNRWCRDDTYHLDIYTPLLKKFKKNGQTLDVSTKWNNRQITWTFTKGPTATNIKLYFKNGSNIWWGCIIIQGMNNGILKVEEKGKDGKWYTATTNSDLGQQFILTHGNDSTYKFTVRITDMNGAIYYGKALQFGFPTSCPGNACGSNPMYEISNISQVSST